jgi:anti-sigma regulatory factor (Ser/Thr protein kinase)
MNRQILLLSEQVKDREFVEAVADLMSATVTKTSFQELNEKTPQTFELCFFDAEFSAQRDFASKYFSPLKLHALLPAKSEKQDIQKILQTCNHLVIRKFDQMANAAQLYAQILRSQNNQEAEGLERFFESPADIQRLDITQSGQRASVSAGIQRFLGRKNFNERVAATIATAVDEVLMNAIYDAVVDENGKRVYERQRRNTNFPLESHKPVNIEFAIKDDFFGIMVRDQYGSAERGSIASHISKYTGAQSLEERDETLSGSGLGLALIIRAGASLSIRCVPGKKTEVCLFFKNESLFKNFSNQFQFLTLAFEGKS